MRMSITSFFPRIFQNSKIVLLLWLRFLLSKFRRKHIILSNTRGICLFVLYDNVRLNFSIERVWDWITSAQTNYNRFIKMKQRKINWNSFTNDIQIYIHIWCQGLYLNLLPIHIDYFISEILNFKNYLQNTSWIIIIYLY